MAPKRAAIPQYDSEALKQGLVDYVKEHGEAHSFQLGCCMQLNLSQLQWPLHYRFRSAPTGHLAVCASRGGAHCVC